jgi:hypothetical protein
VKKGSKNLCPPWVETEQPVLDSINREPFLDTPLDIEELTPTTKNVMLTKAKIPPIIFRLKFLGSNYVTRSLSNLDHRIIQSLQEMARGREDPMKVLRGKVPWIYTYYADIEPVGHLIAKDVRSLECSLPYQTLLINGSVSFK